MLEISECHEVYELFRQLTFADVGSVRITLQHLNNFCKHLKQQPRDHKCDINFTDHEVFVFLNISLINSCKEIRAAGLRAIRHFITCKERMAQFCKCNTDLLVARSLDLFCDNDGERIQAIQLIRKLIRMYSDQLTLALVSPLIAIARSAFPGNLKGKKDESDDHLSTIAVAVLCELALTNPERLSMATGGISVLVSHVIVCPQPRWNEAVLAVLLRLINHPDSRQYIHVHTVIEHILSPLMSCQNHVVPQSQVEACRLAIVSMFRSWPGMIRMCRPDCAGLQSLLGVLSLNNHSRQTVVLEILHELFFHCRPRPLKQADKSISVVFSSGDGPDPSSLMEGFVVSEAAAVLNPALPYKIDLTRNHTALLLTMFVSAGLLETLVGVILHAANEELSVSALYTLARVLKLTDTLLCADYRIQARVLPTLMTLAASFDSPGSPKRLVAQKALAFLQSLYGKEADPSTQRSCWLRLIITHGQSSVPPIPVNNYFRFGESPFQQLLRFIQRCEIMNNLQNSDKWNFGYILTTLTLLRSTMSLMSQDDLISETPIKFLKSIAQYFQPDMRTFSSLEYSVAHKQKTNVLMNLFDTLFMEGCETYKNIAADLLYDIVNCIRDACVGNDVFFARSQLLNTMSSEYFLLIGHLSLQHPSREMLEKIDFYSAAVAAVTQECNDALYKLCISCLNYANDRNARMVLQCALSCKHLEVRLYATRFFGVLLRAYEADRFQSWMLEALIVQLYDKDASVSAAAFDIIEEACEQHRHLRVLFSFKPSLLHLGDRGRLLFSKYFQLVDGFEFLRDHNMLAYEVQLWKDEFCTRYVSLVQAKLDIAFCKHAVGIDGSCVRTHCGDECLQKSPAHLPNHLFGELCHHTNGAQYLLNMGIVEWVCNELKLADLTPEGITRVKAALWSVSHMASSPAGLDVLPDWAVAWVVKLAEEHYVYSVRGTALYAAGLIGLHVDGALSLSTFGWISIQRSALHGRKGCNRSDDPFFSSSLELDSYSADNVVTRRSTISSPRSKLRQFDMPQPSDYVPCRKMYKFRQTPHQHKFYFNPTWTASGPLKITSTIDSDSLALINSVKNLFTTKRDAQGYAVLNELHRSQSTSQLSDILQDESDLEQLCWRDFLMHNAQLPPSNDDFLGIAIPCDLSVLFQDSCQSANVNNAGKVSTAKRKEGVTAVDHHVVNKRHSSLSNKIVKSDSIGMESSTFHPVVLQSSAFEADDPCTISSHDRATCLVCHIANVPEFANLDANLSHLASDETEFSSKRRVIVSWIIKLLSSVTLKSTQQTLLKLKADYPKQFNDLCFYSEVNNIIAVYGVWQHSRNFLHKLFSECEFEPLYVISERILENKGLQSDKF